MPRRVGGGGERLVMRIFVGAGDRARLTGGGGDRVFRRVGGAGERVLAFNFGGAGDRER